MIKRNTWITLIVLIASVAFFYFIQKTNLLTASQLPTSTPVPLLLGNTTDPITSIKLTDPQGMVIVASLDNNNVWIIEQPTNLQISQGNMQEILSDLTGIYVRSPLLSAVPLEATGLQTPTHSLTLTYKSGNVHVINVGILSPVRSGYYVQLDNGNPVIVTQSNIDNIIELLSSIIYTPTPNSSSTFPLTTETPKVSSTVSLTTTPLITPTP